MTAATAVGVGIIGAGNVLPAYLQVLDRLVPRGIAWEGPVCARRTEAWDGLRERRPAIRLVADPLEVLRSDVDVVLLITPPEPRPELARQALEHGKHVVCEKPFAVSRAAADGLFELAAERALHLLAAPFVQLSPTFRDLWTHLRDGAIGHIHSARGLYGNAGSPWASWYHGGGIGTLAENGVFNIKSLTAVLGPAEEVVAAEALAVPEREAGGRVIDRPDPDVCHLVMRHAGGAISSIVSSQAIQHYRRPGLEFYGTEGTANLLGDDWDPAGFELWRNRDGYWRGYEPLDATWLWADGLREAVEAVAAGRQPLAHPDHDLHVLDVVDAARASAADRRPVAVPSRHELPDLRLEVAVERHHVHDRTRPFDAQ